MTAPMSDEADSAGDLIQRMRRGERLAIARVVTELERLSRAAPELLAAMYPYVGSAIVLGITGPPGAGKSTLVNALVRELRHRGLTLGIVAVDPSSPISGGAILGDRVRMTATLDDDGVFMRSLASRGHVGGLSPAAVRVIDALDAAGKDVILVETVGTGQSEIDVATAADVRIVVAAPGLGDGIQAMKAGLLEIADVLVVNKADREGAERTASELAAAVSGRLAARSDVPVLRTIATTGTGVAALVDVVLAAGRARSETTIDRRRRRARLLLARQAAEIVSRRALTSGAPGVDDLCDGILLGTLSPEEAARRLLQLGR
jgi:LAO/AO transport system kinase